MNSKSKEVYLDNNFLRIKIKINIINVQCVRGRCYSFQLGEFWSVLYEHLISYQKLPQMF